MTVYLLTITTRHDVETHVCATEAVADRILAEFVGDREGLDHNATEEEIATYFADTEDFYEIDTRSVEG